MLFEAGRVVVQAALLGTTKILKVVVVTQGRERLARPPPMANGEQLVRRGSHSHQQHAHLH
eukprot:8279505-Pyramimonas_sp.AAC.1